MQILVVGGTRYFGKYTIKALLQKGHAVTIATRGNAAAAARILNLSQRILNYKIKNYSINTAWFKNQK